MTEDDDPVVASFDVYLTKSETTLPPNHDTTPGSPSSKLLVLQYPAHRPLAKPYNNARSQKPSSLRLKPVTGMIEMEIPIMASEHYNASTGDRFGKAMAESRTLQAGGTHGLAGGFGAIQTHPTSLREVPLHEDADTDYNQLETQILGGKVARSSERDPVYLLGTFCNNSLYLSHLDGVVQMRPQLHHVDAEEEVNQKRFQAVPNGTGTRAKVELESGPAKLESKAIEIKIKDSKDDAKDRNLNENAKLLREIQKDQWSQYHWIDQDQDESFTVLQQHLQFEARDASPVRLRSSISNGDWLDKMSAPREDGKKGLLAKLRGRERERARRKKAEEEKKRKKAAASTGTIPNHTLLEMSSDSELSSASETEAEADEPEPESEPESEPAPAPTPAPVQTTTNDQEMTEPAPSKHVQIKQEPEPAANTTPVQPNPVKRRGRPRKHQSNDAIDVED